MSTSHQGVFLSIVSPVYGAEKIVPDLVRRIEEEVTKITTDYEIVLVEDASPDKSWEVINAVCANHPKVVGIKLSRNFGQHAAITCGISHARGEYVVVMDCDLQDDPVYIKDLLAAAKAGADVVFTRKTVRKHSWFKNITASWFNRIFSWLLDNKTIKGENNVGSYSLITRKVVDVFLEYGDYRRHYLMVLRWLGFSQAYVQIEHKERHSGESSYSFRKLISHAMDGITWQSTKLLRIVVAIGLTLAAIGFLAGIAIIIRSFFSPFASGWASTMVLILFSTGMLMASIGITGVYVGNVFEQAKKRPIFVVDEIKKAK